MQIFIKEQTERGEKEKWKITFNRKIEYGKGSCIPDVRKKHLNFGQETFTKPSFVKG